MSDVLIYEGEDEAALRDRFALLWARYPQQDLFAIGMRTFEGLPDAASRGCQAATYWMHDLEVLERKRHYTLNGTEEPEVNKTQLGREVLALARREGVDVKERLSAYKLYSEINGFMPEKGGVVVNNNITNKVMKVRDHGSVETWEEKLARQQAQLTHVASAPN